MDIFRDDARYEAVADHFVEQFIEKIILVLHRSDHCALDVHNFTENDKNLVFEICFASLAEFEDHGSFIVGEDSYVSGCVFLDTPIDPTFLLTSSNRTDLHGSVEFEIIDRAAKSLAKTVSDD